MRGCLPQNTVWPWGCTVFVCGGLGILKKGLAEKRMNIVIIGVGTIGKTILKTLSAEDHTITIIDQSKSKVEELVENFDVMGVIGNGACLDIQKEAGAEEADLVIAMTGNDEMNIFACLVAKHLGVKHTAARVRNPAYSKQISDMKDDLGISMIINPERETAREIFSLIDLPSVARVEHFANGKAMLVEIIAQKGCMLIGETLFSMGKKISTNALVCAVQRKNDVFIPSGDFTVEENDKLYFTANTKNLGDFLKETGLTSSPLKRIMIVGGGRVSYYLADALENKKYSVKLIERDRERAEELAHSLPHVCICCGDGTGHDFLIEEGLESMDALAALTDVDEENVIVSMFANKKRVKKTIAQIKGDELLDMYDELGIKNIVSAKHIVAERISGYVRALENSRGSNILALYQLVNNRVEALEFAAKQESTIYGKPLKELRIKKGCLIACIIRSNDVIIPNGNSVIKLGDNVVVVTAHKNFDDLTDAFE